MSAWKGFAGESLAMLVLTPISVWLGWKAQEAFLGWASANLGDAQLVMTDPSEYVAALTGLALAMALPPLVGWSASLLHRFVAHRPPRARLIVLATLVPMAFASLGALFLAWQMRSALEAETGGLVPYVSVESLGLGGAAARWGLVAAAGVLAITAWRARSGERR